MRKNEVLKKAFEEAAKEKIGKGLKFECVE